MAGSKRNIERVAWDKLAEYIQPLLPGIGGVNKIIYVDANRTGATNVNSGGTPENPKATIAGALTDCTTNVGDIVIVAAEHTETIDADGDLDVTKNDVKIIGLGEGDNRPLLTISTLVGANITISGSGVVFANMRIAMSIDAATNPFVVTGNGCVIKDIEYIEGATMNANECFAFTGDRCVMDNVVIKSSTGGTAPDSAIHLAGCDDMIIRNVTAWGADWAEGLIQNETTTCTNILIDKCYFETEATENIITAWLANASGIIRDTVVHLGGAGAVTELENAFGGNVARLIILDNVSVARVDGGPTIVLGGKTTLANEQEWYVDSVNGNVNNSGTSWEDAVALIDTAINKCTTSVPATIHVSAAHAESIADALTIVPDYADITIIGEGSGDNRATITITNAAGNIPISGAGVRFENFIITCSGVTTVTAGITVSGAGVTIKDVDFLGVDADTDFAIPILTTNAAERLTIENCHINVSTTLTTVGISIVGAVDLPRIIDCEFTGTFSTSCINTTTVATTNMLVKGCMFRNNGTPALAFTHDFSPYAGSTYQVVDCYDVRAGAKIDGSDETGVGLSGSEYTLTRSSIMSDAAAQLKGWTYCGSIEITNLFGVVTTVMTADATASKFQFNPDAAGAVDLCAAPTDGFASDATGTAYYLVGDAAATVLTEVEANAAAYDIGEPALKRVSVVVQSKTSGVIAHTAGHANQTGVVRWSLRYKPVDRGSFAYKTP